MYFLLRGNFICCICKIDKEYIILKMPIRYYFILRFAQLYRATFFERKKKCVISLIRLSEKKGGCWKQVKFIKWYFRLGSRVLITVNRRLWDLKDCVCYVINVNVKWICRTSRTASHYVKRRLASAGILEKEREPG